jgi:hypothetical protein
MIHSILPKTFPVTSPAKVIRKRNGSLAASREHPRKFLNPLLSTEYLWLGAFADLTTYDLVCIVK